MLLKIPESTCLSASWVCGIGRCWRISKSNQFREWVISGAWWNCFHPGQPPRLNVAMDYTAFTVRNEHRRWCAEFEVGWGGVGRGGNSSCDATPHDYTNGHTHTHNIGIWKQIGFPVFSDIKKSLAQ